MTVVVHRRPGCAASAPGPGSRSIGDGVALADDHPPCRSARRRGDRTTTPAFGPFDRDPSLLLAAPLDLDDRRGRRSHRRRVDTVCTAPRIWLTSSARASRSCLASFVFRKLEDPELARMPPGVNEYAGNRRSARRRRDPCRPLRSKRTSVDRRRCPRGDRRRGRRAGRESRRSSREREARRP